MKIKLIALTLLAASGLLAQTRFFVGARMGYPVPAPVAVYAAPPAPLAAYVAPSPGPGYNWVAGYWTRPAFAGARWIAPRYAARRYYGGHWRR
jgi:hypothetical protein